ncbi:phage terminase large subunit [Propionibacteriaceae bacterium Y1700]|uniref:phage terminase large subunit n=1 Tax=Microlunatus sp. Y1700 TaxID=3418487 RepID=UPI003DA724DC
MALTVWDAMLDILNPPKPERRWATPGDLALDLDPRTVQTPALDLIDAELVRLLDTPDGRLIVSMPPQEGKSQRCSRRFPLWALTQNPDTRIAIASYEHGVARRWGRAIRDDITVNSLDLAVRDDLAAQHEWQLAGHEGGVYSVGIGAALTGRPVDLLVIDDPIKDRVQADSVTFRERVWDWWQEVGATRLAPGAPVVVILTRWHEDDLAGRLLAADDGHLWRVVNIPAEADTDDDPLGREPGEFMRSARGRTREQWEAIKVRSGARTWASLYQGRPSPAEGDLLRRDQWQLWHTMPDLSGATLVQSWDLAFKGGTRSDYVVGQVWARVGADCYLLDQVRGRWSFTETCAQIEALTKRWPAATAKYVEDKANGPAVMDALRGRVAGLVPVNPEGGKEARAAAIQPLVEARNVWLPARAEWVDGLIEEAAAFPNATHDDQVDALTQALTKLMITRPTQKVGTTFFDIG